MEPSEAGQDQTQIAKIAGIGAFVLAAIAVMALLHRCHGEDGPAPGQAAARLAATGVSSGAEPNRRGREIAAKFDREVANASAPGAATAGYLRLMAQRSGAGVPVADFKAESQAWLARFMNDHRADLVRSSDALLLATVTAQTAAAMALRTSSQTLCAHYATAGLQPGDAVTDTQALVALDQANAARVLAMGFDRRHPTRLEPTTMVQADAAAFAAGLIRQGATSTELDQMASPGAAAAMPPERQCDRSIKMLRSIASLPPQQAGRVAAVVLQDPAKVR